MIPDVFHPHLLPHCPWLPWHLMFCNESDVDGMDVVRKPGGSSSIVGVLYQNRYKGEPHNEVRAGESCMGGSRWKEGATSLWCPCYGDGAGGPASISVQVMDTLISISTRWKDRKASTEPNKFERRLEKRRMETTVPRLKWPNKKGKVAEWAQQRGKKRRDAGRMRGPSPVGR